MGCIPRTKVECASVLERFLNGTCGHWEWDDFCSFSIADHYLDSVRIRCTELILTHPSPEKGHYCSQAGFEIMRELVAEVRAAK
jgi:hypothetical protein